MKIGLILFRLNVKGGTQRQALSFVKQLKEGGHDVTIYSFYFNARKTYEDLLQGIRIVSLDERYPGWDKEAKILGMFSRPAYLGWWFMIRRAAYVLSTLIDRDTELLNPQGNVSYFVSYFFWKKIKRIPLVWMLNTMPSKTWGFWKRKTYDPSFRISPLKFFFYMLLDYYEALYYIRPHVVVVLDNADQAYAKKYLKKDAVVVRSGIEADQFPYKEREATRRKGGKIFLSGIFFDYRRFEDAIEAAKILIDRGYQMTAHILGDYNNDVTYYKKLKQLIANLSLEDKVSFKGIVSESELIKLHHESDVAVFPYHLQSWGLAVFEAIASGTPVVVSKTLGASEVLVDRKTALLVDPQSPKQIADAIETIFKDPNLYHLLSKNGRAFVEHELTRKKYTDRMIHIFEKAIENKRA